MTTVQGVGFLPRDPEIKEVGSSKVFRDNIGLERSGPKNEKGYLDAAWIQVEAWGIWADFFEKHFKKGSKFRFAGTLHQDTWMQDGQERTKFYIKISAVEFLPKNSGPDNNSSTGSENDGKQLASTGSSSSDKYNLFD